MPELNVAPSPVIPASTGVGLTMPNTNPKNIALQVLKSQEDKDFDIWDELFDESVIVHFPYAPDSLPARFEGRDQWREVTRGLFDSFDKITFSDTRVLATEDPEFVVLTTRSEANFLNGRKYENEYVFCFRVQAGKVVEYWEYYNPLAILKVMAPA